MTEVRKVVDLPLLSTPANSSQFVVTAGPWATDALCRIAFSDLIAAMHRREFTIKSANYTAIAGDVVMADLSTQSWTLTLPASPSAKDSVLVFSTLRNPERTLTINMNGRNYLSSSIQNWRVVPGQSITFIYVNASIGWVTDNPTALVNSTQNSYVHAITYTGNGGGQVFNGFPFRPDIIQLRNRNTGNHDWRFFDRVRGDFYEIMHLSTNAQSLIPNSVQFLEDGFQIVNLAHEAYNQNGSGYFAMAFSTALGSGVSVRTYTGSGSNNTIPHNNPSGEPDVLIIKNFLQAHSSILYHKHATTNAWQGIFRANTAWTTYPNIFTQSPDNVNVYVGTDAHINSAGANYLMYSFKAIPGVSAFGSYIGNGNTPGPSINLGFRPRFLVIKPTSLAASQSEPWNGFLLADDIRQPGNVKNNYLPFYEIHSPVQTSQINISSTGFQPIDGGRSNTTNIPYVYLAWA